MSQKTWGGRFSGDTDDRVEAFTESISFDRRLYRHDIAPARPTPRMLAEVGLLTADEAAQICAALDDIAAEIERGEFAFSIKLEDIHTHIERALIERLGDVGRKLHTGRSRNDQVVTDVKLWVRDAIDALDGLLARPASRPARLRRARPRPGAARLHAHAAAQPVLAAHYFLAYVEKYQRDRDRLADCRKRVNVLPLGAAALAGTSLPIDRDSVRRQLGFDALAANSLDVSSDRDFAAGIRLRPVGHRPAPERLGRGMGAVDDDGVRLPRSAGRLLHRLEHHAAQEEPGRAGIDSRQSGAGRGRFAAADDAGEGAAAGVQSRFAGGQGSPVRRPRHGGRVAGTGGRAGARDAFPQGGDRRPAGGRLSRRDDADGVSDRAGGADAGGARGGWQAGAAV